MSGERQKKGPSPKREGRAKAAPEAVRALFASLGGQHQARLVELWRHWRMVMGEDITPLARPLGHKDRTLLVGAEDGMAMQELSLLAEEMRDRANAFMGNEFFSKVRVSLPQGKPDLARERRERPEPEAPPPPVPAASGDLLGVLPPDSPVGRCYAAYAARRRGGG